MSEATLDEPREEAEAVRVLRSLNIFSADQAAVYRENFSDAAAVLGPMMPTKLIGWLGEWATSGRPGAVILTGNAGTGKTACAEAFCNALSTQLPVSDQLTEIAPDKWVGKDLSGLSEGDSRQDALRRVLQSEQGQRQMLLCANEGVLRDTMFSLGSEAEALRRVVEDALRTGAADDAGTVVVNLNRQRLTATGLWNSLCDYLSRAQLWHGCGGCPMESGCPMVANARALRQPEVRVQLRTLVQLAAGEAVPTTRELLGILAYAIVGGLTCGEVQDSYRDRGKAAFTSRHAYFHLLLGGQLKPAESEQSPLMMALRATGLGTVSDLEVDGWLRDSGGAPPGVRRLAGAPDVPEDRSADPTGLADSISHLDRITTALGTLTFHVLGETVSTGEDPSRVSAALDALVIGTESAMSCQHLWRSRAYFEDPDSMGGSALAATRLLAFPFFPDLVSLAGKVAAGQDTTVEVREIVRGLNFLVTGFASANEGLIVPEPACLFARDPGSFRSARPSFVHNWVDLADVSVRVPDRGLVRELLDVDDVDVELVVNTGRSAELSLALSPRLHEAIRQAAAFRGPAGQGIAEMTDLRSFYGELARELPPNTRLQVADPNLDQPALVTINLPHVAGADA